MLVHTCARLHELTHTQTHLGTDGLTHSQRTHIDMFHSHYTQRSTMHLNTLKMKPKPLTVIDQSDQSELAASGQEEDGCNYPNIWVNNLLGTFFFFFALFEWKSSISFFNSSFIFIFPVVKHTRDIFRVPMATAVARQHKTLKHPFQNSDRWNERERKGDVNEGGGVDRENTNEESRRRADRGITS